MTKKYPINKFKIIYSTDEKMFHMLSEDGELIDKATNGRELGRDAWNKGAEEVEYNYDLGLDENLPLLPRHAKYNKT